MSYPKVFNANKKGSPVADVVYIGRPSKWGNPFTIGCDGSREDVIAKFERYILSNPKLLAAAKIELRGKSLCCWCAPLACHGDVLLRLANGTPGAALSS